MIDQVALLDESINFIEKPEKQLEGDANRIIPVRGDPTAGNAYMKMGMEVQFLPPGVEHADAPGISANKPPVSSERDEGVPDTAEQEVQNKLQV
jgi:hypothetical protein